MPEARIDDGLLDFLLVKGMSRLKIAEIIGRYKQGRHSEFPEYMSWIRGKRMEITCEKPDSINADGELSVGQGGVFTFLKKA